MSVTTQSVDRDQDQDQALIYANGINGATGEYLLPPQTPRAVSLAAQNLPMAQAETDELKLVHEQATAGTFGVRAGVDPKDLAQTGWAVLFAANADPAIRDALKELLDHRREQATRQNEQRYKEFFGPDGYRAGESHRQFLARNNTSPGMPADAACVPYYVLIVGDPESIPYSFQYQLDVMNATGRISFDTPAEYAQYAHSVVEAERSGLGLPRQAAFFGTQNPGDAATHLSAEYLVKPLAQQLASRHPDWSVQALLGEDATKARLARLLGGPETPALLFTASHGMGFPKDDPRQLPHQGALLCQDWPGPLSARPIPPDQYLAADDVGDDARLLGLIAVHFACYGAGTPRLDEYAHRLGVPGQAIIAERAFLARLPRRLLAHSKGGALAAIGHVERAWGYSFHWPRVGQQTQVFEDFFTQLLDGHPIGSALDCFNLRYASLSAELSDVLESIKFGKQVPDVAVANMWTANNDAKNYMIVGDPAVRLPIGTGTSRLGERPTIATVVLETAGSGRGTMATSEMATTGAAAPSAIVGAPSAPNGPTAGPNGPVSETGAPAYGLFDGDLFKDARAALADGLQRLATQLGQTLGHIADEATSVEVRTYTSDDLPGAKYEAGELTGPVKLRAFSRISVSGSTVVCVPEAQGAIDQPLWSLHLQMVERAQVTRAELIKVMTGAATELLASLGRV